METLSLGALTLLLFRKTFHEESPLYEVPGIIPLMLLLGYMVLQVIPMPQACLKLLSPATYSVYTGTAGIIGSAEWYSLSIAKKATISEFFRTASYAAFYILTVQLLKKRDLLKRTIAVVVFFASSLSFFAVLQRIFSNNKIFWIRELTQGGNPFGPYVNRNHYAGLMEMLFPVALGIFLFYKPDYAGGSLRKRVAGIFSRRTTSLHLLAGLAALLIATSIFLSLSRGGIISLCLSMLLFGAMLVRKFGKLREGIFVVLVFILILYTVGWFGWDPIFKRFAGTGDAVGVSDFRLDIWKDGMNIARMFPFTGTGFGSFKDIYPQYSSSPANMLLEHAHNDYIELLVEGGIIGSLLFFWFVSSVLCVSYRVFMKRRGLYSVYLSIGSLAGLIALLLHSLIDFNLHIGANGLYFFFLAGLAVSASHTRTHEGTGDTYLHKIRTPLMVNVAYVCIPAAIILISGVVFNAGILTADYYGLALSRSKISGSTSGKDLRAAASRASLFDPLEPKYHYALADMEWTISNKVAAISEYEKAVRLNPVKGEYLQRLGWALSGTDKGKAARLLLAGVEYDRQNPASYSIYAAWMLKQGDREAGIRNFSRAIFLESGKTKEYITLMVLNGLSDREIQRALPDLTGPHLDFADYLHGTQQEKMAEEEYLNSLNYIKNEKEPKPYLFYRAHKYYTEKKLYDKAVLVMEKAIAALPEDITISIKAAEAYEKAGFIRRAAAEYQRALVIDPGNKIAPGRLNQLQ